MKTIMRLVFVAAIIGVIYFATIGRDQFYDLLDFFYEILGAIAGGYLPTTPSLAVRITPGLHDLLDGGPRRAGAGAARRASETIPVGRRRDGRRSHQL